MEEDWRLRDLQRRCWRLPDPDRHLEVDGEYGWRSLCVVVGSELIGDSGVIRPLSRFCRLVARRNGLR